MNTRRAHRCRSLNILVLDMLVVLPRLRLLSKFASSRANLTSCPMGIETGQRLNANCSASEALRRNPGRMRRVRLRLKRLLLLLKRMLLRLHTAGGALQGRTRVAAGAASAGERSTGA